MFRSFNPIKLFRSSLRYSFATSNKKDYYSILGVPKEATKAQVKKAFAQKAREFHPDKNSAPDAKDKFSDISEAYETLGDDNKRKVYDTYGMGADEAKQYGQGFGSQGFDGFWNQGNMGNAGGMGGFDNMFTDFEDIFGFNTGGRKAKRPSRGADIVINMELSFMEAINGISKEISFRVQDVCGSCNGNKCKPGTSPCKCPTCNGKGNINYRQGPMVIQMTCEACMGVGTVIKDPCSSCKGTGSAYKTQKETIKVPSGIDNGKNLRLSGKGSKGENGGMHGDVIIKISVKPDPYFKREGYDIYTDIPISISQSVLGDTLEVRTVYGPKTINIPAGTGHGNKVKIPNEGVKKLDSHQKGDHFCVFNIQVPKNITPEMRKVFEQLRDIEKGVVSGSDKPDSNSSDDKKGFFNKFTEFCEKSTGKQ